MKKLFTFLGAVGFVTMGCGGDAITIDGGADGSSGMDGAKADGSGSDSGGMDSGGMDSGAMDSGGNDGGGPMDAGIECMDPTTCGNNPYCCATITAAQGNPPACFYNGSYGTTCTQTCTTSFNAQCGSMSTRRLCNLKSQCTENAYNQCCTVTLQMQSVSICMSATEAQIAQAPCK